MPSLTNETLSPAPKRIRRQAESEAMSTADPAPGIRSADDAVQRNDETIDADIAQAKQLVQDLKRAIETREAQEDRGVDLSDSQRGTKRGQSSDEGVALSGSSGQERIIKSNKRVKGDSVLLGGVKTVAYGSLILGIGLGLGA